MGPTAHPQEDQRSLAQLFSNATHESSELVRKEIELAKLELSESISELKMSIAGMAISLPLLFGGFLMLLLAAVFALDLALHRTWLSALIVGVVVMLLGAVSFVAGKSSMPDMRPKRSVESLREDRAMVGRHVGSEPH
jgi:hypothetical protein